MQKDIRLHGLIDDQVEYYAIVAGSDAHQRYFFNQGNDDGELRFFSPGNEFIIGADGVSYRETAAPSANTCSGWISRCPTWPRGT